MNTRADEGVRSSLPAGQQSATADDVMEHGQLLTSTLLASPVIRAAVQATLRPRSQRPSVVFARATELELLEVGFSESGGSSSAYLSSVHRQPTFGTVARMAVLYDWASANAGGLSHHDDGESSQMEERHATASQENGGERSESGHDRVAYEEDGSINSDGDHGSSSSSSNDDDDVFMADTMDVGPMAHTRSSARQRCRLPPAEWIQSRDLLVVTSDSGLLTFLAYGSAGSADYYTERPQAGSVAGEGRAERRCSFLPVYEHVLGHPGLPFDNAGHHLCVDPYSRALAVSGWQNDLRVFLLQPGNPRHPARRRGQKMATRRTLDPIAHEFVVNEELGVITGMTFLWPRTSDKHRILLAITNFRQVAQDIMPYATILQFWADGSSDHPIRYARLPLGADYALVTHVLALPTHPETFSFITEARACTMNAEDARNGNVAFYTTPLPTTDSSALDAPGLKAAAALPLITALASCAQPGSRSYGSYSDAFHFYMGTDTGALFKATVTADAALKFTPLGRPGPAVGEAMLVVSAKTRGELLVISGEFHDGRVELVAGRSTVQRQHVLQNWSPVIDFDVSGVYREGHDAIYACCGGRALGSIREFRHGISMTVHMSTEPELHGVNGLWALRSRDSAVTDAYIVTSFATDTRVLAFKGTGELEDISELSGFALETRTLAATSVSQMSWLQVHPAGVRVVTSPALGAAVPRYCDWTAPSEYTVTTACIYGNTVLFTLVRQGEYKLLPITVGDASGSEFTVGEAHVLDHEPSALGVFRMPNRRMVTVVATRAPELLVMTTDTPPIVLTKLPLDAFSSEGLNIVESLAFLALPDSMHASLIAGLRDGSIVSWPVFYTEDDVRFGDPEQRVVGMVPVKLRRWPGSVHSSGSTTALLLSDRAWRLQMTQCGLHLESVLYTRPDSITEAVPYRVRTSNSDIIFSARSRIGIATLGKRQRVVSRAIISLKARLYVHVSGEKLHTLMQHTQHIQNPRRILFDQITAKLLVACSTYVDGQSVPAIRVLDPACGDLVAESLIDRSEVVYSMIEWRIPKDTVDYRYICVGTATKQPRLINQTRGRFIIYNLRRHTQFTDPSKRYEFKSVWNAELPGPVLCLCPLLKNYLMAVSGTAVYVYTLDMERRKLRKFCKIEVRNPISTLSAYGNRVVVGCQYDSFLLYEFDEANAQLIFLQSDRTSRLPTACVMCDDNFLVGADQGGHIVGLSPSSSTLERTLQTRFSVKHSDSMWRVRIGQPTFCTMTRKLACELQWPGQPRNKRPIVATMLGELRTLRLLDGQSVCARALTHLQLLLQAHPLTRPILGMPLAGIRADGTSASLVLDGDVLQRFLLLSRSNQLDILGDARFELTALTDASALDWTYRDAWETMTDRETEQAEPNAEPLEPVRRRIVRLLADLFA
ncbi:mono-functional DNA-alkylating methyl methanesulfonate N-term-domain-containing protein [Thamnocephalis sphaerospora]|uniref:DNA damage-binding protein 1 n=1 Tax=Thamnocephalis sphaerospora TaxID=78915 RepID=A0A4P9XUW6_9FUNG|nr:mono-functional DNA-alkylating methyl methanesulfonate N-term-domain-containing protein [Thamnocephalis sphaerospora]|eukprot:RKP10044.1 mono-functional DNA-alkylating methyl methanesulfonate N-term-domain-containing protein [Thamnocephalis sphaerospora]